MRMLRKIVGAAVVFLCLAAAVVPAQDEALIAIGALGASYLYSTYLSIGAIADGHYYEVYDDQTTSDLMGELMNLAGSSIEALQGLLHSDTLDSEDFNYVTEMINILGLLQKEAESYQSYIESGDDNLATRYDNYRNNAWTKLSTLLGIEEE
jgi:hypothetical protein